ncbi:hypothetical protein [Fictibacillus phosphorivorans]|uniref:hypothetical protein n=1 Tax=Fictibacillus phosphorivorans TaxID=1221500 RepID=UPI00203F91A9|nr:hypothetical protein [Fictibacillus phosphorivorans]MCM3720036.1 hypothetical protein [Fictibacillus phosphorivorans]MCM3777694.1 hypothetical protein [Fictibacillus phosphorivorans]
MEEILLGFIYTFLIVLTFEAIFTRKLHNHSKPSGKKIVVLGVQSLVITLFLLTAFR